MSHRGSTSGPMAAGARARRWPLLAALGLVLAATGCGQADGDLAAPSARQPVQAVVTLPPLAYFLDRLGEDRVALEVLLPPRADPHTFEPAPRQRVALSRAHLVVQVGHPSLPFEGRFVDLARRQRSGLEVVTLSDLAGSTGGDPHPWVDPHAARSLVTALAEALTRLDPAAAPGYEQRRQVLLAEIDQLDQELRALLAPSKGQAFLVQHPAWTAFAARYGLTEVALESDGKEPGPRRLAELVQEARHREVRVVLVQRGLAERAAQRAADQIGAELVEVDPLSRDWPASLRQVAQALRDAHRGDRGAGRMPRP